MHLTSMMQVASWAKGSADASKLFLDSPQRWLMKKEWKPHAMLWTVEPSSWADKNKVVLLEDAVQPGKHLYWWQDYTDYLQPVAFAVQTKVMLATGHDEDSIEREWSKIDLKKMASRGMTHYAWQVLLDATTD